MNKLDQLHERRGTIVGVPTGFTDLDHLTGGLQKSDLIILAARPAIGKTSLALTMAHNTAIKHQRSVAIFSLEMSKEQLVQRLLSMDAAIDQQRLRTGWIEDDEWERIVYAMGTLSEANIWIDDTAGISTVEMRSKARRLHAERNIDLIIVDYLQLMQSMSGSGKRNENRVQEISEISRNLKSLARELNVPVLALAQLSRAVESRQSKVPQLSDLRESGSIEQDSDIVMFIYRDDVYNPETERKNIADIIVAKHRESGCITGDTPVYLPDTGNYCPIEQLVGQKEFRVLALNTDTWQLEPRTVSNAFSTGCKPVYRLTTRLGRTIRATANHKFLTMRGWQRLDALSGGERIALPRRLPGLYKQNLSRERATRLAQVVQCDKLTSLAQSDVYWDEIIAINPDGEAEVYDLTVDELHNFVAGDIIPHNSIEQDSDIVMFIYRDDVYNPETERKNIADIIVAKHRNGPVGTISLYFQASQTRFHDLELTPPSE